MKAPDTASGTAPLVSILDDEPDIRALLQDRLDDAGFRTMAFGRATEFEAALKRTTPDVCLVDLGLPDRDGLTLVHRLALEQGARVIIVEKMPQLQVDPEEVMLRAMMVRWSPDVAEAEFGARLLPAAEHETVQVSAKAVFDVLEVVEVVSLSDMFRNGEGYRWFIDGRSDYADDDHISAYGASLLQDRMTEILEAR
mgnify:CR=1 FL=1